MYRFRLYGLTLASDRPLPGIAPSGGWADPDVRVGFDAPHRRRRVQAGDTPFVSLHDGNGEYLRVLRTGDGGYVFRFVNGERFEVASDGARIVATWPARITFEDVSAYLLGTVLGFVARLRGTVCLHASAVLVDGAAVAFLAPGGAGKSTLCAYFAQRGRAVLTDDVLALHRGLGAFEALAGPARLRLWPDSARHLYGAHADLPRVLPSDTSWDKRYIDIAPALAAAPLAAIYTGEPGETESPSVSAISGRDAFLRLVANRYPPRLSVPARFHHEYDILTAVAATVPVRYVHTRRDLHGLSALHDAILEDLCSLRGRAAHAEKANARVAG